MICRTLRKDQSSSILPLFRKLIMTLKATDMSMEISMLLPAEAINSFEAPFMKD